LFDSFRPEKWRELGISLGLRRSRPSEAFAPSMCFRRIERSRGEPAEGEPPHFGHWLWGSRQGLDVVVLQYETGCGSSRTTWTAAIARIDPPLWLGLEVRSEGFIDRVFGEPDVSLGDRAFDDKLRIRSFDPARAALLLSPGDADGRRLLEYLVQAVRVFSTRVTDSYVEVANTGVNTDPSEVGRMLAAAVQLASGLSARRGLLPPAPYEQVWHAEWQRFADAGGFRFHPGHMVVAGERQGTLVEIGLEVEEQTLQTAVNVRFPRPLPYPIFVGRTTTPWFLQGIFSQDIKVGDRAFDDAFLVQGEPESAIRQLLSRPALLQALNYAASCTRDLRVGADRLFLRFDRPTVDAAGLESLVAWACTVSRELVGSAPTAGPFR
jgi:hypothetical protein